MCELIENFSFQNILTQIEWRTDNIENCCHYQIIVTGSSTHPKLKNIIIMELGPIVEI